MANETGPSVRRRYHLPEDKRQEFDQWQAIREQCRERIPVLQQKILDMTRLIEGEMTRVKLAQGWQDGDATGYDPIHGDVVVVDFGTGQ